MFKLAVAVAFVAGFSVVAIPAAPGAVELVSITAYLIAHPTARHALFCTGQAFAGLDGLREKWKAAERDGDTVGLPPALEELSADMDARQSEACKGPA